MKDALVERAMGAKGIPEAVNPGLAESECAVAKVHRAECDASNRPVLYGDGHAAERIVDVCLAWWTCESTGRE